ncbi:MAG: methyltransferase [Pseudomonadota bacterium]
MSVQQVFDQASAEYDQLRRAFIPCFDDFYGVALSLLPRPQACGDERPIAMLELGAGTGLLSAMILEAIPTAHLTLVDLAPRMLAKARERLSGLEARVDIRQADYLQDDLGGPYRAVISALSIHHLEDVDKRRLWATVHGLLAAGGVFINADLVLGASPWLEEFQSQWWLRQAYQAGITPGQMAQARQRMAYDRLATLEDQLAWLRQAGFVDVDCLYRHHGFVVYTGRRSE